MSEEVITPDPQETPEEVVVETPDPLAEREAAIAKREAELKEFERKVNERSTAVGLTAKQVEAMKAELEAAKPAAAEDDDFDPEQLKVLEKALKKLGLDPSVVTSTVQTQAQREQEEIAAVGDAFFGAHKDIDPTELFAFLGEMGVEPPKTAHQLKKVLESGGKAFLALKADPESTASELANKKLQELAENGETIKEVKPKRSGVSAGKRTLEDIAADKSMSFWEKAEIFERE